MDNTDKLILKILSKNSSTPATQIGQIVGLSVPAVNKRIAKLKAENIISSFTVTTNGKNVEKPIIAFILIVMHYVDSNDAFLKQLNSDPDILECYAITGEYDYLLKVCAKDVETLENKLLYLKKQKNVLKSHTMFSLMEHKFQPTVLPDMNKPERTVSI